MKTNEIFAIGFHEWCMYTGFPGFNDATYQEKINQFKRFMMSIPHRPEVNSDPFFNFGLAERQAEWDEKYKKFYNPE